MEQVLVKFYIKGKLLPIKVIFESKANAKEFIDSMEAKDVVIINDYAISMRKFKYARFKVL